MFKKLLIGFLIILHSTFLFAKGNRQDDPSYQVDHNRTKNFTPTVHFTQDQIDRVSDIFSGMTGNTFTINSDLQDVTSKLIFGRTTGGNAEISYDGDRIILNKLLQIPLYQSGSNSRMIEFYSDSTPQMYGIGMGPTVSEGYVNYYSAYDATTGAWADTDVYGHRFYVGDTQRARIGGATAEINVPISINTSTFIGTEKLRVNGDIYGDGTASLGALTLREKSADPADPAEGQSVIWQADGTGAGDDGDLMVKITAGGITKTTTLIDFSGI